MINPVHERVQTRNINHKEHFLEVLSGKKEPKQQFNLKKAKHSYHPPSKVLIEGDQHQRDFLGMGSHLPDPLIARRPNEDPKEFKLPIHAPSKLKNKKKF